MGGKIKELCISNYEKKKADIVKAIQSGMNAEDGCKLLNLCR